MTTLPLLHPDWPAIPGVGAAMSLREGGVSHAPWDSLNLGVAVGDDPEAVIENRARFSDAIGAQPVWLRQVHGRHVRHLKSPRSEADEPADASWTSARGVACTVQSADCMPVLFALRDGSAVAAAHAGWRGLAGGVLQATLDALCGGTGAAPGDVQAWLGPTIGPRRFEVGEDVLEAFGSTAWHSEPRRFTPSTRPDGSRRWLADLPALAQDALRQAGVRHVSASNACTVEDGSRFFSYRRDRITGRMAAAIWRT